MVGNLSRGYMRSGRVRNGLVGERVRRVTMVNVLAACGDGAVALRREFARQQRIAR